ncbi:MAG: Hsp20/alpha crystallin family protein [Geopsychrobacter sp.]|nr:Hsp20/alpha crystallin family protein [Geopsychrobacter sp.]
MMNWNIFQEMETLRREMDAIFGGLTREQDEQTAFMPGIGTRRFPRLNLNADSDNFYLTALLPGVESKTLEINLTGNTLALSGERIADPIEGAHWQRQERGQGKFMRAIELPLDVATDKISAEYADGVLCVTLPKAEAVKPKRIAIKAAK